MFRNLSLALCLMLFSAAAFAQVMLKQDHPAQFISYWKSSVISPDEDAGVRLAHTLFKRLLRGWESSRLEPGLYVVDSEQGAWAVSLVDGNILLSRQAINRILDFGTERAEHLMAFVLAHELAHQKSDDLWQHRFFRQSMNQQPNNAPQDIELQMDQRLLQQMEQQEAQADYDGMMLMVSVGFNPHYVVTKKDFFTEWVENIWQKPCASQHDEILSEACMQAKMRAQRTRSQLKSLADQAALYQLGVQAMVAGDYAKARYYFSLYGRDYPSRAVMSAIGSSHLAEAIQLRKEMIHSGELNAGDFYFPLILDARAGVETLDEAEKSTKRAAANEAVVRRQNLESHVQKAVNYFEKAIRLAPENRKTYQQLINAYLAGGNVPMARGILQGRYIPQFGEDMMSRLLQALTVSVEGDQQLALNKMNTLCDELEDLANHKNKVDDVLVFAVFQNLQVLLKLTRQDDKLMSGWKKLARLTQQSGNASLFRLALSRINPASAMQHSDLKVAPGVNGLRLGNRKMRDDSAHTINELWIEGDLYHVYQYENGAQYITGVDGKIISARQQSGTAVLGKLKIDDDTERALVTLGLPDRRQFLVSGEYLAYDSYGLALQVNENKVTGWFLY